MLHTIHEISYVLDDEIWDLGISFLLHGTVCDDTPFTVSSCLCVSFSSLILEFSLFLL